LALTKKTYLPGDTLTAEQVNNMQDAIIKNQNSITGFGLGGVSTLTTDLDTNNINGWYFFGVGATNRPQHIQYGCLFVANRSGTETEVVQTAFSPVDGTKAQRTYRNSTDGWSEWEYENPPMVANVEYRTTERWNGDPLYTMLIPIGSWANNGYLDLPNASPFVMRYCGRIGDWTLPFINGTLDNSNSVWTTFHNNNGICRLSMFGGSSVQGKGGHIQIWYTRAS
jgi:hypothetical protein